MSDLPAPDLPGLSRFLTDRFGPRVHDVSPLGEGKWSRAFSFSADERSLVIRFGDHDEDFIKDRIAASWRQPGLPVPTFVETGAAFGTFYAVTERAEGRFLDHLSGDEVSRVVPSLFGVLDALRRVPVPEAAGFGLWNRDGVGRHSSWKDALLTVGTTRPRVEGWQERMKEWPECGRAYDQGAERLHLLADLVPSRRDVIHRDLVNRNVLVTDSTIASVFDWGSSMYGDHLYDVAWLTFCASYTSGFDRTDMHRRAQQHYVDQGFDPDDFDLRVSCYELHIGLGALIYQAFLGDRTHAQSLSSKVLASFVQGGRPVRLPL
jgi:hygromycin-B 4-O-kinase